MTAAAPAVPVSRPESVPAKGYPTAWWGMAVLIATEATIFLGLLSAYFFVRAASRQWPQGGIEPPQLGRIIVFSFVLWGSSLPLFYAEPAIRRGARRGVRIALFLSFVLGLAFIVNQGIEYHDLGFGLRDNAYASLFYVITGLHGLHVIIGLLMNLVVQLKAALGRFGPDRHLTLSIYALYWHFVDAVWVFVFASLYLSPHIR